MQHILVSCRTIARAQPQEPAESSVQIAPLAWLEIPSQLTCSMLQLWLSFRERKDLFPTVPFCCTN